jgi:hypothetical protein
MAGRSGVMVIRCGYTRRLVSIVWLPGTMPQHAIHFSVNIVKAIIWKVMI